MNFDWRAIAIAAGAAFLISFLVGVFAGVAFGVLLLRAIIAGIVFGGGTVAVSFVIDRFLPDLRQQSANDGESGHRVDIVVDDDAGFAEDDDLALGEAGDASEATDGYDDEFRPGIAASRIDADEPTEELEAADEESDDASNSSDWSAESDAEPVANDAKPRRNIKTNDEPEELEELAPEVGSAASLPDIEGFSQSFGDGPSDLGEPESGGRSGEDPGIMARAIRTVLKREE